MVGQQCFDGLVSIVNFPYENERKMIRAKKGDIDLLKKIETQIFA